MFKQAILEENKKEKKDLPQKHILQRVSAMGTVVFFALTKNPFKTIIRVCITLAFVYIVNRNIKMHGLVTLLENIELLPFSIAFFLGAASLSFQVLRWQLILISHQLPSGMAVASKTMFRGFLFAFLTPGRLGELFKAMDLDKTRKTDTVLAVIEERFCAVIIIVAGGIVCSAGQVIFYSAGLFLPLIFAALIFSIGCIAIIFLISKGEFALLRSLSPFKWLAWLPACIQRWKNLPFLQLLLYSLCAHFLLLLQTSLLFNMFGKVDLIQGMLISGQAYMFMLLFPFFIANIGLREYSFSFFLAKNANNLLPIAASATISFCVATLILFFNIMVPAAIGIVWMYTKKQPKRNVAATFSSTLESNRNDSRNTDQ
jgi:hypothetical protein